MRQFEEAPPPGGTRPSTDDNWSLGFSTLGLKNLVGCCGIKKYFHNKFKFIISILKRSDTHHHVPTHKLATFAGTNKNLIVLLNPQTQIKEEV
jgi:hypothetical protein